MTDRTHLSIDPAERQEREWIDATVRGVIEEFRGRFELMSEHAYTPASSIVFYDVRDVVVGEKFRLVTTTLLGRDMGAVAADLRRQLQGRTREVA